MTCASYFRRLCFCSVVVVTQAHLCFTAPILCLKLVQGRPNETRQLGLVTGPVSGSQGRLECHGIELSQYNIRGLTSRGFLIGLLVADSGAKQLSLPSHTWDSYILNINKWQITLLLFPVKQEKGWGKEYYPMKSLGPNLFKTLLPKSPYSHFSFVATTFRSPFSLISYALILNSYFLPLFMRCNNIFHTHIAPFFFSFCF